ncbi:hypothetical protein B296_00034495 [Ensete ventricosum]|uniref:Uncharacterized protein n=1 Tax=Ensete ventricosum TaxID=4639 RepID=A0A426XZT6_ENSVE|nr:hypothetical protein B296_00034495 [Ensete ventricosum]
MSSAWAIAPTVVAATFERHLTGWRRRLVRALPLLATALAVGLPLLALQRAAVICGLAAGDYPLRLHRGQQALVTWPQPLVPTGLLPRGYHYHMALLDRVHHTGLGNHHGELGVSYEYGCQVTLARFQAWYPDLEVDSDPFTEKPEDGLVPMETRQEFDDSIPPEE